jgi:hypothetical protein
MKNILLLTILGLCACATTNHKIASSEASKVKSLTVISVLGSQMTIQKQSTASKFSGVGGYEKDIDVTSWAPDASIEAGLGKKIQASGIRYLTASLKASDRSELEKESGKLGTTLIDAALNIAKKSTAEYAMIIDSTFTNQRLGSFKGSAEPLLLKCNPSDEELATLATVYRYRIYRIQDKALIASSPLAVEAKYNGALKCHDLETAKDAELVKAFHPAFQIALQAIIPENIASAGLEKTDIK